MHELVSKNAFMKKTYFNHLVFVFSVMYILTSLLLLQGGYYRNVGNAALFAFGVFGLLLAAGCMHALKKWGKQPYNNWHKQWMYIPLAGFSSGGCQSLSLYAMRSKKMNNLDDTNAAKGK